MPRRLACKTGPIEEEEVLSLLELETQPTALGAGVHGGWVVDGSEPSVEYWQDAPGAETSGTFSLRSFWVLPSITPAVATKLLYDVAYRKKWDNTVEMREDPSDDGAFKHHGNDIVRFRTSSKFGALPSCYMLHGRLKKSPCGTAYSAWVSRDADEVLAEKSQGFRLERVVVGHVVRSQEDGCRIFTYVQMEATPVLKALGPELAPGLLRGWCSKFSRACRAELAEEACAKEVMKKPGQSDDRHVPEFFDMSAGDETGSLANSEPVPEATSHSAGLDFLGVVDNKKLVPAVSAFRRLLRKSAKSAARRPEAGGAPGGGSFMELPEEPSESGRRRRSSALRERNRERQRGSMEAVAERLGQAVRLRSQHGRDSGLEVVLEEEDDGSKAKCPPSEAEKQLHAANPGKPSDVTASRDSAVRIDSSASSAQPRKRFSLPLPVRRRRSSGSVSGSVRSAGTTDSEDSMSSAGIAGVPNDEDMTRRSADAVLDSFFDRARAPFCREGSSALSTTTASSVSSRPSSPCLGSPAASLPGDDGESNKVAKPTLAGAAWVLTQLCKETTHVPDAALPSEPSSVSSNNQVATRLHRGSLMSAEAFKFCFPQDICGVPLESKAAFKDPGWKRSSNRNRRRATAA
ncbi:unnamed protein product [Symbiodinium natans]|uniref:START domain-containing protein n=1 Tax=Symbiodinium natans TaxID=878477 RepID=A0A812J1S9_9DINO|nr:unnamed protein product [Symbiodinium natans]